MGLSSLIARACKQTAIYWGNPINDGYGKDIFDSPIELLCRWEDKIAIAQTTTGINFISKCTVFVHQDVDELGYMYLGSLDDLDSSIDETDPINITGAHIIKRFEKIPELGSTVNFIRKAYLSDEKS